MRRIAFLLCLLVVLSVVAACGSNIPSHPSVELDRMCGVSNGVLVSCDITLTNSPASKVDFNWKASSTPGNGVTFDIPQGILYPGDITTVHVEFRFVCPHLITLFFTGTDGTVLKDQEQSCQSDWP